MNLVQLMNPKHRSVPDGVVDMKKVFGKGSEEWQMFTDYWKLCQGLWNPEQTDKYWEEVIRQTDLFYKKYKTPFAKGLVVALAEELDRRSRKGSDTYEHV